MSKGTPKKPYSPVKMDDVPNDEKEQEDKDADAKEEVNPDAMTPQQKLYYYCKRGDIEEIKNVTKNNLDVDINARDEIGWKGGYITFNTALHFAVVSGSLETVKVVYDLEANPDSTNKIKSTPLHIAASLGYVEIVEFLLSVEANKNAKNAIQNTALHCAIYAGHVDTVKAILDKYDDKRAKRAALGGSESINGVGMSPAKYTAHDEMKAYLRQFFPKKDTPDDDDGDNEQEALPPYNDDVGGGNNDVQEEDEEEDEIDEYDDDQDNERAKLTGPGNATATEQYE